MPKPTKGPRLGSSPAHERKILANLAKSLIEHESIVTTETKARRLQPYVEKLITKARKGDIHNRRLVARKIGTRVSKAERSQDAVYRLFDEIVPRLDPEREGGFTRIVKLPPRRGDNAPMAQISLIFDKVEKKAKVSAAKAEEPAVDEPKAEEPKADEVVEEVVETAPEATESDAVEEKAAEDAE